MLRQGAAEIGHNERHGKVIQLNMNFSRRQFLGGAIPAAGCVALSSHAACEQDVLLEPPHRTAVRGAYDVIVAGGGPAGVAAAVAAGRAGSHQGRGWETFTDAAIRALATEREHLVFLLWGSYAGKKAAMLNNPKHLVLKAPHPSPLSAYRGFFGCRHFSKANEFLTSHGETPIDWQIENI